MAKTDAIKAERTNLMWVALAYLSGKRSDRDAVPENSVTPIVIDISGKFGRAIVRESICGELRITEATNAASSSAANVDQVCALLLRALPDDNARAKVMGQIAQQFAQSGALPACSAAEIEHVKVWLKRLRSSVTIRKRGALVFAINEG